MVITLYIYYVHERMKEWMKKTTIYQFEDGIRAMELKSWIFCRYGSPIMINHPKTSPNIDKSTFKCTHCNKIDPTNLDIPQLQSNDFCYDQENNEEPRVWTMDL